MTGKSMMLHRGSSENLFTSPVLLLKAVGPQFGRVHLGGDGRGQNLFREVEDHG